MAWGGFLVTQPLVPIPGHTVYAIRSNENSNVLKVVSLDGPGVQFELTLKFLKLSEFAVR